MKPHPISEIFPDIEGKEFDALVEDIKKNGLKQPLEMYQGKILDGRNRWRACQAIGLKPKTKDYKGDDPVGHVISLNLTRRHLSESQRAMVAAKMATLNHGGVRSKGSIDPLSSESTAKRLNVSEPSVKRARKVLESGTKVLQKAVERDEIAVSTAAELSDAPAEVQRAAVKDHGKDAPALAKRIAEQKREEKPSEPPIKTLGLDVPADVLALAEKEQELVDKMDRMLAELNRTYTAYQKARGERAGLKTGQRHQTALKEAFDAFSTIRGQRPASVCPHCKLWPEIRKTCACCRTFGFIGKTDLDAVEKCLLVEGDEAGVWVAVEGKRPQWRTMISLRGEDF